MCASGITFAAGAEEEVIDFQERALQKFVKDVQDKKVGPLQTQILLLPMCCKACLLIHNLNRLRRRRCSSTPLVVKVLPKLYFSAP